jgi:hypothetical protein
MPNIRCCHGEYPAFLSDVLSDKYSREQNMQKSKWEKGDAEHRSHSAPISFRIENLKKKK